MTPDDHTELSVSSLLALRQEADAVRAITDKLRVKDMGPADHIRTKHEVKAFVETGDATTAEQLLQQAKKRHALNQNLNLRVSQQRGQRVGD